MVKHLHGVDGLQGFELTTDSGRLMTLYAAGPGTYDLGQARNTRQVCAMIGDMTVEGSLLIDGKVKKGRHRIYGGPSGRGINIASGRLQIEVAGQSDVAFAVYEFDD